MHTPEAFDPNLLDKAKKTFDEVVTTYKCSEDYLPRHLFPHISIANLNNLNASPKKEKIIQRFLIQELIKRTHIKIQENASETLENPQLLATQASTALILKHGECEELAGILMLKLMKEDFPIISRHFIQSGQKNWNHVFVVITDKNKATFALDPFFKIFCPLQEYWQHHKLISYFKALAGNDFDVSLSNRIVTDYPLEKNIIFREIAEKQVAYLTSYGDFSKDLSQLKILQNLEPGDALIFNSFREGLTRAYKDKGFSGEEINRLFSIYFPKEWDEGRATQRKATFFQNPPHEIIVKEIKALNLPSEIYQNIVDPLKEGKYGTALRRACTSENYGPKLLSISLKYCSKLILDEQGGDKKYAAIHYAAERKSPEMYQMLVKAGADVTLKTANGRSAEQIYKDYQEKINNLKQKF